jgi:hypothetical protein
MFIISSFTVQPESFKSGETNHGRQHLIAEPLAGSERMQALKWSASL